MSLATEPQKASRLAEIGFEKMAKFRQARMLMLNRYTSRFYGKANSENMPADPLNLIYQAVTTLVPNLVYSDPKAMVSTEYLAYRPYTDLLELALNVNVRAIRLAKTLRKIITDSIFLAGFYKSGLAVSGQTLDIDGFYHDIGQTYADRVDPDDMVLDPSAREWEECKMIGNRYQADSEQLIASGYLTEEQVLKLSSRYQNTSSRKEAGTLSSPSSIYSGEFDQLLKEVDLVDLWLPEENVIVTMPWLPENKIHPEFLRVTEYNGPESGPYGMLGYAFVPDNILPVAPAMIWTDLHVLANKMARKMARQADRSKRIIAYESSNWQDAQAIVDADDGETVRVDSVDGIREIQYGGTSDDLYEYFGWVKEQFSEMAMNIDLLSGVGTDEPTATQAEMLQANTSVRLSDMQNLVYHFTGEIMEHLAFFLHTDPLIELPLIRRTPGGEEQQVFYTPEMREGDWLDYHVKVKPYSMARQDPNRKVRRLIEFSSNVIPAVATAYQILGPAYNIEAMINIIGREMGIEELDEIINSPALHQQMARMQEALAAGIPLDEKVIRSILGPGNMGNIGGPAVNLNQPNPMAQMQAGVTPTTETNQIRQESAAELQAANGPPLNSAMAGAMAPRM